MKHRHLICALAATAILLAGWGTAKPSAGSSQPVSAPRAKPTIVIEHGAFANASGWTNVIRRLKRAGYPVLAPANPLRGVASDSAYLESVLATIRTPIVLVGHSYGGAVITNAAVGVSNVKVLVYIAAVAPDQGESQLDIFKRFPAARLGPATILQRPFPGGVDQYVKLEDFRDVFAADRTPAQAAVMAATQRPLALAAGTDKSGPPAWRTLPSWYLVAKHDHAINPAAERFMAKRIHAHTVEVESSHDVMVSHPAAVAKLILAAARSGPGSSP